MSAPTDVATIVRGLLARAPEWIRTDLSSKESGVRARAEETLAAMIEAALDEEHGTAVPETIPNSAGTGE